MDKFKRLCGTCKFWVAYNHQPDSNGQCINKKHTEGLVHKCLHDFNHKCEYHEYRESELLKAAHLPVQITHIALEVSYPPGHLIDITNALHKDGSIWCHFRDSRAPEKAIWRKLAPIPYSKEEERA